MVSQKQMKEWLPETLEQFKAALPPIGMPYPEFYIFSNKDWEMKRAKVVEAVQAPQKNAGRVSMMEYLHGAAGDAVIIFQKYVFENPYNREEEKRQFQHCVRHELGHFYAAHAECPGTDLYQYMDQKPRKGEEAQKQVAYWFWVEFIAETIACRTDPESWDVDINWDKNSWYPIRNELRSLIHDAFERMPDTIYEWALGVYMAKMLSDRETASFLTGAKEGKILTYGSGFDLVTFQEAGIDPTCRSEIGEDYKSDLLELETLMRDQVAKERFWEIDDAFLLRIDKYLSSLKIIKMMNAGPKKLEELIQWYKSKGQ